MMKYEYKMYFEQLRARKVFAGHDIMKKKNSNVIKGDTNIYKQSDLFQIISRCPAFTFNTCKYIWTCVLSSMLSSKWVSSNSLSLCVINWTSINWDIKTNFFTVNHSLNFNQGLIIYLHRLFCSPACCPSKLCDPVMSF